jgi:Flp pilus assembly secretin CpaC
MTMLLRRAARWLAIPLVNFAIMANAALIAPAAAAPDAVTISLDEATLMKLPERVATIVIGNPLIADVSLQQGGIMIVTGKGFGVTNLLALDRSGTVLMEKSVRVQSGHDGMVVVYRGVNKESYSCTPGCERRITLGDNPDYFTQNLSQAGAWVGQAQSMSQSK